MKKINIIYEQAIRLFNDNFCLYCKMTIINKEQKTSDNYDFGTKGITNMINYNFLNASKYYVPMNEKYEAFEYMKECHNKRHAAPNFKKYLDSLKEGRREKNKYNI